MDGVWGGGQGVFHGGVRDAAELVNGGQADASEFQLVAGYSGWGPHQLSGEIHDKSWYVISASRDIILECARIRGADEWVVRSNIWEDILRLAGIDPYGIGAPPSCQPLLTKCYPKSLRRN
jgi:putative AlgH/UPF0301 family transcriptional regulator